MPAIIVVAHAHRGSDPDGRAQFARSRVVMTARAWNRRRRGTAIGRRESDHARDDQSQEPGRGEVARIGREPLDRHRDQEHATSDPSRSPILAHDVGSSPGPTIAPNPFGAGRIIARIRRLASPPRPLSGLFSVNDPESPHPPILPQRPGPAEAGSAGSDPMRNRRPGWRAVVFRIRWLCSPRHLTPRSSVPPQAALDRRVRLVFLGSYLWSIPGFDSMSSPGSERRTPHLGSARTMRDPPPHLSSARHIGRRDRGG